MSENEECSGGGLLIRPAREVTNGAVGYVYDRCPGCRACACAWEQPNTDGEDD